MRVRWTTPAAKALLAIQEYIARDNPRSAFEVAQHSCVAVAQLQDHPKVGREGRVRGTREFIVHGVPYIVPFRIRQQEIQMLSVYHASRKWPEPFE